jgi:hypothetical protein
VFLNGNGPSGPLSGKPGMNGPLSGKPGPKKTDGKHGSEQDASFLVLFNANREEMTFTLAPELRDDRWQVALDSAHVTRAEEPIDSATPVTIAGFSVLLLRRLASGATPIR